MRTSIAASAASSRAAPPATGAFGVTDIQRWRQDRVRRRQRARGHSVDWRQRGGDQVRRQSRATWPRGRWCAVSTSRSGTATTARETARWARCRFQIDSSAGLKCSCTNACSLGEFILSPSRIRMATSSMTAKESLRRSMSCRHRRNISNLGKEE